MGASSRADEAIAVDVRSVEHEASRGMERSRCTEAGMRGGGSYDSSAMERKTTSAPVKFSVKMTSKSFEIASIRLMRLP